MTSILEILLMILSIVKWIVLVHIILSWLINFQVLNMRQPLVAQIWFGLNQLLDPIYTRLRRLLPNISGIDFAPLLVLIAIFAAERVIMNNLYSF